MGEHPAIGVLGGTFDPVHRGHRAIARSFLESGLIDKLWILLTPSPPHKERSAITPYPVRLEMLHEAFDDMEDTLISDLERHLESPSYTWRTLRHLQDRHPEYAFHLCIGGDSLAKFTEWKNWRMIIRLAPLVVAERPPADPETLPEPLRAVTTFVEHTPVAISSSAIRETIRSGGDAGKWLPEGVGEIIRRHNLYRREDG